MAPECEHLHGVFRRFESLKTCLWTHFRPGGSRYSEDRPEEVSKLEWAAEEYVRKWHSEVQKYLQLIILDGGCMQMGF